MTKRENQEQSRNLDALDEAGFTLQLRFKWAQTFAETPLRVLRSSKLGH